MPAYMDAIEANIKANINVLEMIYESDRRLLDTLDIKSMDPGQYDEYLDEHDAYSEKLADLDAEYDELFDHIRQHPDEASNASPGQKQRIADLLKEMDGKIQAVNDIEAKARELTEQYIGRIRRDIATSRMNAKVIQTHYISAPAAAATSGDSILDVSN